MSGYFTPGYSSQALVGDERIPFDTAQVEGQGAATAWITPDGLLQYYNTRTEITMNKVWGVTAHDGVSEFYTTPIYHPNFVSPLYPNPQPVIIFQGYDWFVYVVNALTGVALTGWPVATTGPCYGRCQAANIGPNGNTVVFAATHGNETGQCGSVYAFSAVGNQLWNTENVYQLEGFNDGNANTFTYNTHVYETVGGTTNTGGSVASATANSLTVGGTNPNWPANAWQRYQGVGFNAVVKIVAGTAVGQINEITGVTAGQTLEFASAWGVTPDATSQYQIIPRYSSDVLYQHAGTLNIESGTTYLYVTSDDNTLVKLNALSGAKVWRFWAGENNEPFPLIQDVRGTGSPQVLFNSIDGYTYCINPTNGLQIWRTNLTPTVGLDSILSAAPIHGDGNVKVVVNQRRSGSPAAGRTYYLNGNTGAIEGSSTDQLGDMSSGPLLILRNDGSGRYWIFSAGNACIPTLYDDHMNGLWRNYQADNSAIDQFRSTAITGDFNYDGLTEILACMQNTAAVCFYSLGGTRLATIVLPSRIGATDGGIEGTPCTFFDTKNNLNIILPCKDGTVSCYVFSPVP